MGSLLKNKLPGSDETEKIVSENKLGCQLCAASVV